MVVGVLDVENIMEELCGERGVLGLGNKVVLEEF